MRSEKPLVVLLSPPVQGNDHRLDALKLHLRTAPAIELWDPDKLAAGSDVSAERARAYQRAAVFLALVSAESMENETWTEHAQRALGSGRPVIPVILRPCFWEASLVGHLQPVPAGQTSLSEATNFDRACLEVVTAVVESVKQARPRSDILLDARQKYVETIERHVAQAHPLGLLSDLPVALRDVWTPVRAFQTSGAEGAFQEILKSIVSAPVEPETQATAVAWAEPAIWHLLGDPGSGKSWAMLRAAADLAEMARKDPSSPLPLLITARELVEGGALPAALRNHATTTGPEMGPLLDAAAARWILLVDGMDEAGDRANEVVQKAARWFGPRLAAMIVSSRSTFVPRTGRVTDTFRLSAWGEDDVEDFLDRWQAIVPQAVARLRKPAPRSAAAPLLSLPQTATLCVLAAADADDAVLRNRAALVDHVLQTLWKRRSELRSSVAKPAIPWEVVAPVLRDLAGIYLSESLRSLSEARVETIARKHHADMAVRIKEALIYDVGLLTRVRPGQVDFPFRIMAEHLLGTAIWARYQKKKNASLLARLSRFRCAEEAVRFAIVWADHLAGSKCSVALFDGLLAREGEDDPGFEDRHLRSVLVAIRTSAGLALPPGSARALRRAAFRRIREESSCWVGDQVAEAVRSLAISSPPHAVPLFRALVRVACDPRPSPVSWYAGRAYPEPEEWRQLQAHRDAEVRALSNVRLAKWAGRPDVVAWLFHALDDGPTAIGGVAPALAAARVLRRTDRGLWPEGKRDELLGRLHSDVQLVAGGAAVILTQDEARPSLLARVLRTHILGLGGDPEVVRELAATPEGLAALEAEWPTWKAELDAPLPKIEEAGPGCWGRSPPPSLLVRERLWRAIGAWVALHPKLSGYDRRRSTFHSFRRPISFCEATAQEPQAVDELFDRWHAQPWSHWPDPATHALGRAARRHPHVRDRLIAEWDRMRARERFWPVQYPGHALEPLILVGDAEAARIYSEWLPSSERLSGVFREAPIAAEVLRAPGVRDAALELSRRLWAELEKQPPEQVGESVYASVLGLVSGAWTEDAELRGRYSSWLHDASDERFLAALRMGRHVSRDPQTLEYVAKRVNVFGRTAVEQAGAEGDAWVTGVNRCMRLLDIVEVWQVEDRCAEFLRALVGRTGRLGTLWRHGWALLARAAPPEPARYCAARSARAPAAMNDLDPSLRRLVTELAPHAHAMRLVRLARHEVPPADVSIEVLEALPYRQRQRVLCCWRRAFSGAELPWTADWRRHRDSRPADRLRGLLFDYWTPRSHRR